MAKNINIDTITPNFGADLSEVALVKELIYAPEFVRDANRVLKPSMFTVDNARRLYGMISDRFAQTGTETINLASIFAAFKVDATPEAMDWFHAKIIGGDCPSSTYMAVMDHAATIYNAFNSRKVFEFADKLRNKAYMGTFEDEDIDMIKAFIDDFAKDSVKGNAVVDVKTAFNQLCDELTHKNSVVPTGYPTLDRMTYGGFSGGNLVIIAGGTGTGKTSVAMDMAKKISLGGTGVFYASLEMGPAELAKKLCLGTDRLQTREFRDAREKDNPNNKLAWKHIEDAGAEIESLKIYFKAGAMSISDICSTIVILHSQGKIGCAVVDYLQIIRSEKKFERRDLEIAECTRRLKLLAMDLNIPIIALSQVARAAVKDKRAPELSDLRESGAIEQDADRVLTLFKEEPDYTTDDDNDNMPAKVPIQVFMRKNRGGVAGNVGFNLMPNSTVSSFTEMGRNSYDLYQEFCKNSGPAAGPSAETAAAARTAAEPEAVRETYVEDPLFEEQPGDRIMNGMHNEFE